MVVENLLESFGLLGLFAINLVTSTVLTFPYEPSIVAALLVFSAPLVFAFSLAGQMVAALINYAIGLKGIARILKDHRIEKAHKVFEKWGALALLLAPWLPFIGDLLTVSAGMARMNFHKFILFVAIGKAIKISAVILLGNVLLKLLGF